MVTLLGKLFQSNIRSSWVEPITKVPPSMRIRPGPANCSLTSDTSKPPFSGLLYSQLVVLEYCFFLKMLPFLHDIIDATKIIIRKTRANLLYFMILFLFGV